MTANRTRALPGALLALLMVLGACGGGTSDGNVIEIDDSTRPTLRDDSARLAAVLASSVDDAVDAGSARISMTTTVAGQTLTAEGLMDFTTQRGTMTMDLSGVDDGAGGTLGELGAVRMVFDGQVMYMQMPFMAALPDAPESLRDGAFVRFDYARLSQELGVDIAQLQQGAQDPAQMLAMLTGVSDTVVELGTEDIDGVATTHYRAVVDLRLAYESAGAVTDPAAFEVLLDTIGTDTTEIEVWIGTDGLPRRQRQSLPVGDGAFGTMVMDFTDWGTPVEVEVPADWVDLLDLIGPTGAG